MDEHHISKEKLLIGPLVVFLEMGLIGNYMESIKTIKQVTDYKYPNIIKNLWYKHGFKCFHIGFYPWGIIQSIKGLPILFVQGESYYLLNKYQIGNDTSRILISGFLSGVSQGLILTPVQRLKTIAMTDPDFKRLNAYNILPKFVKKYGFSTLYKGVYPTMLRRGIDWSTRFYGIHQASNYLGKSLSEMTLIEKMGVGFYGGLLSGFTIPLDVLISKTQEYNNKKKNSYIILKEEIKRNGIRSMGRGFLLKPIGASYHTAFMIGLGDTLYRWIS